MSGRQTQHHGRSAGDDTTLEGRDIEADAPEGVGDERVAAGDGGAEASDQAEHIGDLLEKDRNAGKNARNDRDA